MMNNISSLGIVEMVVRSGLAHEVKKVPPVTEGSGVSDRRHPTFTHQDLVAIAGLTTPVNSESEQGLTNMSPITYDNTGKPLYIKQPLNIDCSV